MILFLHVYFGILFEISRCFYKDFVIQDLFVSAVGKIDLEFALYSAYFRFNEDSSCDSYVWPYYHCDPMIHEIAVIPGEIRYSFNEKTVLLEQDFMRSYYSFDKRAYWKANQFDTTPSYFKSFTNKDEINPGDCKIHYFSSSFYFKVIGVCSQVYDDDVSGKKYLVSFCSYRPNAVLGNVFVYSGPWKSFSRITYHVNARCQRNYFERTCWRRCLYVPNRYRCGSDGFHYCIGHFESNTIKYHYLNHKGYFESWFNETSFAEDCTVYNSCYDRTADIEYRCREPFHLCYPTGNVTFTCMAFNIEYILSQYSLILNATFTSALNTEYIEVRMWFFGGERELIKNYSNCSWGFPDNEMRYRIFKISADGLILSYPPNIPAHGYGFNFNCRIGQYRPFYFFRYFSFHTMPSKYEILNTSIGKMKNIYIGQTIKCDSNAAPKTVSFHSIYLLTDNFNPPKRGDLRFLFIPIEARLGYCEIMCHHSFHFPDGRPNVNSSKAFSISIRSYIHFYWEKEYKNVYTINEFAGCIFLTYFTGSIYVKQTMGPGAVSVLPHDNFATKTNVGGIFRFICILTSSTDQSKVYFKSNTFEIFYMPTFTCIVPFSPTPGSSIVISHNGYPKDQSHYDLTLFRQSIQITTSSDNYIRIPYDFINVTVELMGRISFFVDTMYKSYPINLPFVVEIVNKKYISLTQRDAECMKYSEIQFNIQQSSEGEMIFYSEIVLLSEPYVMKRENLVVLFYTCCIFSTLFILLIQIQNPPPPSLTNVMRALRQRNLNDKLFRMSRLNIIGVELKGNCVNITKPNLVTLDNCFVKILDSTYS